MRSIGCRTGQFEHTDNILESRCVRQCKFKLGTAVVCRPSSCSYRMYTYNDSWLLNTTDLNASLNYYKC